VGERHRDALLIEGRQIYNSGELKGGPVEAARPPHERNLANLPAAGVESGYRPQVEGGQRRKEIIRLGKRRRETEGGPGIQRGGSENSEKKTPLKVCENFVCLQNLA